MKKENVLILLTSLLSCISANINNGTLYTIYFSPYEPMVDCPENSTDFNLFDGSSVRFFRAMLTHINWDSSNYRIICVGWSEMFERVFDEEYSMALGGISITANRVNKGYQFSMPTLLTGATLLVYDEPLNYYFIKIVEWIIIVALIGTVFILGVVTYLIGKNPESIWTHLISQISNLFLSPDLGFGLISVRILTIVSWFLFLCLSESYISVMADFIVEHDEVIQSPYELYDKIVKVQSVYEEVTWEYEMNSIVFSTYLDELHGNLTLDGIAGLIIDDPLCQVMDLTYCDTRIELQNFIFKEFAVIFGPKASTEFVHEISLSILKTREEGYNGQDFLEDYINLRYSYDICKTKKYSGQINLDSTYEIFAITFGVIIFSILLFVLKSIISHKKRRKSSKIFDLFRGGGNQKENKRDGNVLVPQYQSRKSKKFSDELPKIIHSFMLMSTVVSNLKLNKMDTYDQINHRILHEVLKMVNSKVDLYQLNFEYNLEKLEDYLFGPLKQITSQVKTIDILNHIEKAKYPRFKSVALEPSYTRIDLNTLKNYNRNRPELIMVKSPTSLTKIEESDENHKNHRDNIEKEICTDRATKTLLNSERLEENQVFRDKYFNQLMTTIIQQRKKKLFENIKELYKFLVCLFQIFLVELVQIPILFLLSAIYIPLLLY